MPRMPNLENIVSGFNKTGNDEKSKSFKQESKDPEIEITDSDIWIAFMKDLEHPRDKPACGQKVYNIDADIIETLRECELNNSINYTINSILRVFILAHLPNFMTLRKKEKPESLFVKYNNL